MSQKPETSKNAALLNRQFRLLTGFTSQSPAAPAVTSFSVSSSVKKKSAEELFREHREAALQWAKQRQTSATPSAPPTTSVIQNDRDRFTSREEAAVPTEKSAEELFQKHRDAALKWSTNRHASPPPISVPVPREGAPTFSVTSSVLHPRLSLSSRFGVEQHHSSHLQDNKESYLSKEALGTTPLQTPIADYPASNGSAGPFSPAPQRGFTGQHLNQQQHAFNSTSSVEVHIAPIPSEVLPTARNEGSKNTDAGEPIKEENESSQPQIDTSNRTYTEWVLDVTGVSALKPYERTLLLVLFVASPVLVYLLERLILSWVGGEGGGVSLSADPGLVHKMRRVWAYFGTMTKLDVAAASLLGVSLSLTFDRDIAATDRVISRTADMIARTCVGFFTAVRTTVTSFRNTNSKVVNQLDSLAEKQVGDASVIASHPLIRLVLRIVRLPQRIPLTVRFLVAIMVFGITSRVVLAKAAVVVVAKTRQFLPAVLSSVAVILGVILLAFGLRFHFQRVATRKSVVNVLSSFAKALLVHRGRAYPIAYLYEEVAETVQIYTRGFTSSGLFSPQSGSKTSRFASASKPAVVVDNSTTGFLGAIRSVFGKVSGPSPSSTGAGENTSPIELSAADKAELLQQAVNLHAPRRDNSSSFSSASGSHGKTSTPLEGAADLPTSTTTATADAGRKNVMRGYSLQKVWGEVEKAVETDRRVQRVDLIVDGKKHTCWRLLSGSTQAKI